MSFQLAPKTFWPAELISHFLCYLNSSKNITCPSGKLKTEFTSPIGKSTSPRLSDTSFFALCYQMGIFLRYAICWTKQQGFNTLPLFDCWFLLLWTTVIYRFHCVQIGLLKWLLWNGSKNQIISVNKLVYTLKLHFRARRCDPWGCQCDQLLLSGDQIFTPARQPGPQDRWLSSLGKHTLMIIRYLSQN